MSGVPRDEPLPVERLEPAFGDESIEERVYATLLQQRDPVSASAAADEADCSVDAARKYLEWFVELGVGTRHEGRPTRYERNEEYLEWKYVTTLADAHTAAELKATVVELRDRLETYRRRYEAEDPASVDLVNAAADGDNLEKAWDDLSTWAGIEAEIRLHDRARQRLHDRGFRVD